MRIRSLMYYMIMRGRGIHCRIFESHIALALPAAMSGDHSLMGAQGLLAALEANEIPLDEYPTYRGSVPVVIRWGTMSDLQVQLAMKCYYSVLLCPADLHSAGSWSELPRLSCDADVLDISALRGCAMREFMCIDGWLCDIGALGTCANLQVLRIPVASVTDISALAGCTSLRELHIDHTDIGNIGALAACTMLQVLRAPGTEIIDIGALAGCSDLRVLDVSSTPVTDIHILAGCPNLRELDVSDTFVENLEALGTNTNLQRLDITCTPVADITPLAGCRGLRHLYVTNTNIVDIRPLAACSDLREMHIRNTDVMDITPLAACTNLSELYYDNCDGSQDPEGLGKNCADELRALVAACQGLD
jgi:Leucine-rich repeat (LRR) protein